jgi:trigger factor
MEYNVITKEPTVAEVHFKTTKEEFEQAKEKAYKKRAKNLKFPGFRVGKAPIEMVKKYLGDSIIEDALEILLIDTYNLVAKQLKPKPLGLPTFSIKEFDKEKGVEFTAEYEFMPEIEITKYKKLKVITPEIEMDSSVIEDILKKLAEENPIYLPKEFEDPSKNVIEEHDIVLLNLSIFRESDNKKIYDVEEYEIDLSYPDPNFPGLKNNLLGKKVDDEIELTTRVGNSSEFPKVSNKNVKIKAKVLEVRYKSTPPIDDELARFYKYDSLESFKKAIQEELQRQTNDYIENDIIEQIMEQIIEKNPFELPELLINAETESRLKRISKRLGLSSKLNFDQLSLLLNRPKEEVEKEYREKSIKDLKIQVILEMIIENEKIEVSDQEVMEEIKNIYKDLALTEEKLKEMQKNQNLIENVQYSLKVKKALNFLKENSEIKKGDKIPLKKLIEEGKISIF